MHKRLCDCNLSIRKLVNVYSKGEYRHYRSIKSIAAGTQVSKLFP